MSYLVLKEGLKRGHILRCTETSNEIYIWGLNKFIPLDSETEWEYFYHGDGDLVGEYYEISEEKAKEIIEENGKDISIMLQRAHNLANICDIQIPNLPEDNFEAIINIVCECLQSDKCTDFILEGLFSQEIIGAAKYDFNKKNKA